MARGREPLVAHPSGGRPSTTFRRRREAGGRPSGSVSLRPIRAKPWSSPSFSYSPDLAVVAVMAHARAAELAAMPALQVF
jgi:hypothetical protein